MSLERVHICDLSHADTFTSQGQAGRLGGMSCDVEELLDCELLRHISYEMELQQIIQVPAIE